MSNYVPKKGDRVRVVLEGEVMQHEPEWRFTVGSLARASTVAEGADHIVSVELVKPALQIGWHRVKHTDPASPDMVRSRWWTGEHWASNEEGGHWGAPSVYAS